MGWLVALGTVLPIPLVMVARSVRRRVKRRLDEGTEAQQENQEQLELTQCIQSRPGEREEEEERGPRTAQRQERDRREDEKNGRAQKGSTGGSHASHEGGAVGVGAFLEERDKRSYRGGENIRNEVVVVKGQPVPLVPWSHDQSDGLDWGGADCERIRRLPGDGGGVVDLITGSGGDGGGSSCIDTSGETRGRGDKKGQRQEGKTRRAGQGTGSKTAEEEEEEERQGGKNFLGEEAFCTPTNSVVVIGRPVLPSEERTKTDNLLGDPKRD